MKAAVLAAGLVLFSLSSMAPANLQERAVKAVIEAISSGENPNALYPGAVSPAEAEWLARLSGCSAHNLMRQAKGRYTIVWVCGREVARGMEVIIRDESVTSISTFEVFRRPTRE